MQKTSWQGLQWLTYGPIVRAIVKCLIVAYVTMITVLVGAIAYLAIANMGV